MTEQLHDLLTRIADQAGPGSSDPTLWARAQRARRRDRAVRASVAALTALALAGALAIGLGTRNAPPPANQTPAPHESGEGIPSTVRGIHGDGGLDLETDLAVGPASVAIANRSGAFVITTADGVYHRLRLPGFDPAAFNEDETGLALSPDGTRLAYGWHATRAAGPQSGPTVATRILDLRTGALRKISASPSFGPAKDDMVNTYAYEWSPDGRYLAFVARGVHDGSVRCGYVGLDSSGARAFSPGSERWSGPFYNPMPCPLVTEVGPRLVARVDGSDLVLAGPVPGGYGFAGPTLPGAEDWTVGRFTPDGGRLLLQPHRLGTGLVLVTDRKNRPLSIRDPSDDVVRLLRLDPAKWPDGAHIDVLGWVGPDHALAMVNRGTGPDIWEPGGQLVLVDLSSVPPTTAGTTPVHLDVVGRIESSDPGSTYSFATDLATVDAPTQDFDNFSSPQAPDPSRDGALTSQDRNDGDTTRLIAFTAAGLIVLAAISLVLARTRRRPNIHL
jgi:hypothetical protein